MQKVILYYNFTSLGDPEAIKLWQKNLATQHALTGRILISKHGINGTVAGHIDAVKAYVKETKQYPAFKNTVFKWSDANDGVFPRLSVKVRDEIVSFGAGDELRVDEKGVVGGGKHLKPKAIHELVAERGDDVVFFDGRNAYEAAVGKFKNAVVPDTRTSKDFIRELDSGKYDELKDKAIVTYCTGGVRCEILSVLMKNRGFNEVYQADGGIVTYGKEYQDDGLWEGSLYVFDGRMGTTFSDKAKTIGTCVHCASPTSSYHNCALVSCNDLVLICSDCAKVKDNLFHSVDCRQEAA